MKTKDKLIFLVAGCISVSVLVVIVGEYGIMAYNDIVNKTHWGTNEAAISLVQNAVVGLIGILGGYFAGKGDKE